MVGKLKAGDRVPSVRELARQLAGNQNTVLHVFERLFAEGWLKTRQGSRTFVKANARTSGEKKAQTAALLAQLAQLLGVASDELHRLRDQSLKLLPAAPLGQTTFRQAGQAGGRGATIGQWRIYFPPAGLAFYLAGLGTRFHVTVIFRCLAARIMPSIAVGGLMPKS